LRLIKVLRLRRTGPLASPQTPATVLYGAQLNIFAMNSPAIPHFFPPSETKNLGFNETA